MVRLLHIVVFFLLVLAVLAADRRESAAQAGMPAESCLAYQTSISRAVPFPDKLLATDWANAIRCLAIALDELKGPIEKERKETAETWAQFLRATAMLRIIIANNERKEPDKAAVNPAIQEFRKHSTLDAASSLAYGARAADDNARLNATLVFGNVVDNQSVCVAIDHLYDPTLGPEATLYHIRGRANLLGIISVVAPWAYKENYDNLNEVWAYISDKLEPLKTRDDLKQTFEILKNIRARLDFQVEAERKHQDVNKNKKLVDAGYDACTNYRPKWAGNHWKR